MTFLKETLFATVLALGLIILFLNRVDAQTIPPYQNSNFQYLTATLTSSQLTSVYTANAWNSSMGLPKYFSLAVTTTVTGFRVLLEGSLDNTNWGPLAVTDTARGLTTNAVARPVLYFRLRSDIMPANGTITATAVGSW